MGTIYFVGCYDCKVYRDLDKFYTIIQPVETRADVLELMSKVEVDTFRSALLISFMWKHRSHKCTVFTEHMEGVFPRCDDDTEYESEIFWEILKRD